MNPPFHPAPVQAAMPAPVRASRNLWWLAIATALVELGANLSEGGGPLSSMLAGRGPELAVRFTAYLLLFGLSMAMAAGRSWARIALLLIFGVVGTLSLVMEPIGWLVAGGDAVGYLQGADARGWIVIVSRVAHLACVILAVMLMFGPAANGYFRGVAPLASAR